MTYSIQRIVNCLNQYVDKDDLFCLKEARDLITFFNNDLVKGFEDASETLQQSIFGAICNDNATPLYRLLLYGSCAKSPGGFAIGKTRSGLSLLGVASSTTGLAEAKSDETGNSGSEAAGTLLYTNIRDTILSSMEECFTTHFKKVFQGSSHQCDAVKLGRMLDDELKKWKSIFDTSMKRLEQCRDAGKPSRQLTLSDIESCIETKLTTQTAVLVGQMSDSKQSDIVTNRDVRDSTITIPMLEQCLRNVIEDPTQSLTSNISDMQTSSKALNAQIDKLAKLADSFSEAEAMCLKPNEPAPTAVQIVTEIQGRFEIKKNQYFQDLIALLPTAPGHVDNAHLVSIVELMLKPVSEKIAEWQQQILPNQISQTVVQALTSDQVCFMSSCLERDSQCRVEKAVADTKVARLEIELNTLQAYRNSELGTLNEAVRSFRNEMLAERRRYAHLSHKYNESMDQLSRIDRLNMELMGTVSTLKHALTQSGHPNDNAIVRNFLDTELQNVEVRELEMSDISAAMTQDVEQDTYYSGIRSKCFEILNDPNVNSRVSDLQDQLEQYISNHPDGRPQGAWLAMAVFSHLAEKEQTNIELAKIFRQMGVFLITDETSQEIGNCFAMLMRCCMRSMSKKELQDVIPYASELCFKVSQVISSFTNVNQENSHMRSKNDTLQAEGIRLKQNYEILEKNLQQSYQTVTVMEQEKNSMQNRVQELINENNNYKSTVEHWQMRYASERKTIEALEEENIKQASSIIELQAAASSHASEKQDMVSKLEFDKLTGERESLLREKATAKKEFESKVEEIKNELRIARNSSSAFQTDIARLRDELVVLKKNHSSCLPNDGNTMIMQKTEYEDLIKDVETFREIVTKGFSASRGDTMIDIRKYWKVILLEVRKQLDPTLRGKKLKSKHASSRVETELDSSGDKRKRKLSKELTTLPDTMACASRPIVKTDAAIQMDFAEEPSTSEMANTYAAMEEPDTTQ
ncbi:hypothetical protein HDE_12931 [Halotydeus destructor]|nr:hypothetical protein HDE_12931 [Halotydeus destructor]